MMKIINLSFLLFVFFSFSVSAQNLNQTKSQNPEDSIEYTINGVISSIVGKTVVVKIVNQRTIPVIGQVGILQKYFEEVVLGMKTTGSLDIGKMQISAVKTDIVSMIIIDEHSVVIKDGQKINNFKVGKTVNFNWKK